MDKLVAIFLKTGHWVIRILMIAILFQQVQDVKDLYSEKYDVDVVGVESAVQASQLSGEYQLEAQGEMAELIMMAVAAILVEFGIYSTFYVKISRKEPEAVVEEEKKSSNVKFL